MICNSWPIRTQCANKGRGFEIICWIQNTTTTCPFLVVFTTSTCHISSNLGSIKSWDFLPSWLSISSHSIDGKGSKNGPKMTISSDGNQVRRPLFSLHMLSGHPRLWIFMRATPQTTAVGVDSTCSWSWHSHSQAGKGGCIGGEFFGQKYFSYF